jgi:Mg/Co/Ni transporter MgtE
MARERAAARGGVCVVVNAEGIVFGVLREKELAAADDARVSDVMRPGSSTFRPHVDAKEMADYFGKHDLPNAPITTADGRLVGVLFRDAVTQAAEKS